MPGRELSSEIRAQINVLREEGYSYRDIGARLGVSIDTVRRTLALYAKTGGYSFPKRTGRRKCTTERMERQIVVASKKNPFASSQTLQAQMPQNQGPVPSARTIRRRLSAAGLRAYRPAMKPRLTAKQIKARVAFCNKYKNWTKDQWRRVMFSDETTITQHATFIRHVRRPAGKRFDQRYTLPSVKRAPKVMIWGAIAARGRCGLWFMPPGTTIKGSTYLEIVKEKVPNFMRMRNCTHFQHDGAPVHQTKAAKQWFASEGVNVIGPWPGNSPDLNVIENCWKILKEKVALKYPTSSKQLQEAIKEVWVKEIPPELTDKLVTSMPARIASVLAKKGGHIKY